MFKLFKRKNKKEEKTYLSAKEADILSSVSMNNATIDILKEYEEYLNKRMFEVHSEIYKTATKGNKYVNVYINQADDYIKERSINNYTDFRLEESALLHGFIGEFIKLGYDVELHKGRTYNVLKIEWRDKQYVEGDE